MNEEKNNSVLGELNTSSQTDTLDIPTAPVVNEAPKEENLNKEVTPLVEQKPETLDSNYGVIPPVESPIKEPVVKENKPRNNKILIIILIVVFVLLGGAFLVYYLMFGMSATKINTKIFAEMQSYTQTLYEQANEANEFVTKHDNVRYNVNVKSNDVVADLNLDYAKKDKALAGSLNLTNEAGETTNLTGILAGNNFYYSLLKDSSHYFTDGTDYSALVEMMENAENKSYDWSKLIGYYGNSINENVKNSDYTKKLEKVKVNDKNCYAVKYSTVISPKQDARISESFKKYLKADKDLKEYITNILNQLQNYGMSLTYDEFIDSIITPTEPIESTNYNFYIFMGKIIKIEVISQDTSLVYDSKGYQTIQLKDLEEGKETGSEIYLKKVDDKYTFSYTNEKEKILTGEIAGNKYNCIITIDENNIIVSGAYTSKSTTDKITKELTYKITSDELSLDYSGAISLTLKAVDSLDISVPYFVYNITTDTYAYSLLQTEIQSLPIYDDLQSIFESLYPIDMAKDKVDEVTSTTDTDDWIDDWDSDWETTTIDEL